MAFEFKFQIDAERICVQDKFSGYHAEVTNRAVYHRSSGRLLALGEPEQVARARLSAYYERQPGEIHSVTLFGADGAELVYEICILKDFTYLLHRQAQRARPMAYILAKLVDSFDYSLSIPGYETFPESRRHAMEQQLQAHLRLRRLMINGREVQIPMWRRNLEFWLRRLLVTILPLLATAIGYLTMPAAVKAGPLSFLAYLFFILYATYYAGKILWMLLSRRLVPADYRLCMLQGAHCRLSRIDRSLARVFWGLKSAA
jgi:hypothetical protein